MSSVSENDWERLHKLPIPNYVRDIVWRAVHNASPRNARIRFFSDTKNDKCIWCPWEKQTIADFIRDCVILDRVWSDLAPTVHPPLPLQNRPRRKRPFLALYLWMETNLLECWVGACSIYMSWCIWNREIRQDSSPFHFLFKMRFF